MTLSRNAASLVLLLAAPSVLAQPQTEQQAEAGSEPPVSPELSLRPAEPFGAPGSSHLSVTSGAAVSVEDAGATDSNITFAWRHFFVQDVEVALELGAWWFNQDGDNAAGVNPQLSLRWHFLNRDRWTLYADAGIGILASTDDVPDTGTSFNFTPQAGGGATFRLTPKGLRLITGLRWSHISNARIEGEERNPDRDGVMVYGGLSWPL